jgi:hypothetical protein
MRAQAQRGEETPSNLELPKLDKWIQRISAAAMLALALGLVGLGLALYAPKTSSATSGSASTMTNIPAPGR